MVQANSNRSKLQKLGAMFNTWYKVCALILCIGVAFGGLGYFVDQGIVSHPPTNLGSLSDVQLVGLINGQVLAYNSTSGLWTNINRATDGGFIDNSYSFENLTDASFVALANGDIQVYNSETGKWTVESPFTTNWNNTINQLIASSSIATSQIEGLNTFITTYLTNNPTAYSSFIGMTCGVEPYSYLIGVFRQRYILCR